MPADTPTLAEPLRIIDAQGHAVTVTETRSGLLTVITSTPEDGIRSGRPCLNPANALELGTALVEWAKGNGR